MEVLFLSLSDIYLLFILHFILFISNTLIRIPILYPDAYVYLRSSSGWWQHQEGAEQSWEREHFPNFHQAAAGRAGAGNQAAGESCV